MARLYKLDGSVETVTPKNGTDFTLAELRNLVDCRWVEAAHFGNHGQFFILDEEGKLFNKPLNVKATQLYRKYYDDYIVGPALLCEEGEVR